MSPGLRPALRVFSLAAKLFWSETSLQLGPISFYRSRACSNKQATSKQATSKTRIYDSPRPQTNVVAPHTCRVKMLRKNTKPQLARCFTGQKSILFAFPTGFQWILLNFIAYYIKHFKSKTFPRIPWVPNPKWCYIHPNMLGRCIRWHMLRRANTLFPHLKSILFVIVYINVV